MLLFCNLQNERPQPRKLLRLQTCREGPIRKLCQLKGPSDEDYPLLRVLPLECFHLHQESGIIKVIVRLQEDAHDFDVWGVGDLLRGEENPEDLGVVYMGEVPATQQAADLVLQRTLYGLPVFAVLFLEAPL